MLKNKGRIHIIVYAMSDHPRNASLARRDSMGLRKSGPFKNGIRDEDFDMFYKDLLSGFLLDDDERFDFF